MKSCLRLPAHVNVLDHPTFAFIAALPRCLVSNSISIDQQTSTGQRDFCFFSPPLPPKKIDSTNSRSLHKQQHSVVLGSNQFTASQNRQLEKTVSAFFSSSSISFHLRHPPPRKPQICGFELILGPCCGGWSESDSPRSGRDRRQATGHRRLDHWRLRRPFFALNPKRQGGQLAFGSANRSRVVSRRKAWTVDGQPHHLSQQLHLLPFPQDSRAPSLSFPNSRPRQEEASISSPDLRHFSATRDGEYVPCPALPPPPSSPFPSESRQSDGPQ